MPKVTPEELERLAQDPHRDIDEAWPTRAIFGLMDAAAEIRLLQERVVPEGIAYGACPVCGDDDDKDFGRGCGCLLCHYTGCIFLPAWWVEKWGDAGAAVASGEKELGTPTAAEKALEGGEGGAGGVGGAD